MEMEFSKLEKVVGTFIVGVVLLLMSTLVIIGRGKDWFEKYVPYYTTFNESYNLQENASVKLFKADIGKVQSITLTQNRVSVKLLILDQYASRIRQDAVAVVESPTLIGSEYISIIPGSPDAPLIAPNGEIPSKEKRSISDIMSEFEVEKTAKMVVETIQDLSNVAQKLSDPNGPLWSALSNVDRISGNIEQITADLKSGKGLIGALMTSEELLREMENRVKQMDTILNTVQIAVDKTPETIDLVNSNLATFYNAGVSIQERVNQAKTILAEIQVGAANLKQITDDIKAGSTHVPKIATTFRDGVQEIREGVEQINRVVDSLQQNVFIRPHLPAEPPPGNTDAMTAPLPD
jgi:phospholipid/cholesterol/gamma-HCH transport system substrate-binding protein